MNNYKFGDHYERARKLTTYDKLVKDDGDIKGELDEAIKKFLISYDSKKINGLINSLNKMASVCCRVNVSKYLFSNNIIQKVYSLLSAETPVPIVRAASHALAVFLKSVDSNFCIEFFQEEIIYLIFNFIQQNGDNNVISMVKLFRSYCMISPNARNRFISILPINTICDAIRQNMINEVDIDWIYMMLYFLRDVCTYPFDINQNTAIIFEFFDAFESLFKSDQEITFLILHTIRFLIENDKENISFFLSTKIPCFFTPCAQDILRNDLKIGIFSEKIIDDICAISLNVFEYTKSVVLIPILTFSRIVACEKASTSINAINFFVNYMSESPEHFEECQCCEFFSRFKSALQFRNAEIKIHAGHALAYLLNKANTRAIEHMFMQNFFGLALQLIDINDYDFSNEMLCVLDKFEHYLTTSGSVEHARILKEFLNAKGDAQDIFASILQDNDNDENDERRDEIFVHASILNDHLLELFERIDLNKSEGKNITKNEEEEEEEDLDENFNIFEDPTSKMAQQFFKPKTH